MNKYKVEYTETLQRQIEIEASSFDEAFKIAKEKYQNEEIVLDSSDFVGGNIEVVEICRNKEMER